MRVLGSPARDPGPEFVADLVGADGRRTVLALDTYEAFGLLDGWLRRVFLPLLPDQALTIVVGREPPGRAWLTSPGWQGLVRQIPLGGLDDDDAARLLEALGLSPERSRRVVAPAPARRARARHQERLRSRALPAPPPITRSRNRPAIEQRQMARPALARGRRDPALAGDADGRLTREGRAREVLVATGAEPLFEPLSGVHARSLAAVRQPDVSGP